MAISVNSNWPNCRTKLDQHNIHPNKEWIKFVDLMNEEHKNAEIKWDKHGSEWDIYWTVCFLFLWIECYINNEHNGHKLIKRENAFEELQWLVRNELSYDNSALTQKYVGIKEAEFHQLVNERILEDAVNPFTKTIKEEREYYKKNFDKINKAKIELLCGNMNEYKKNEKCLKLFNETKDKSMTLQVSRELLNSNNLKKAIHNGLKMFYWETKNIILCNTL